MKHGSSEAHLTPSLPATRSTAGLDASGIAAATMLMSLTCCAASTSFGTRIATW